MWRNRDESWNFPQDHDPELIKQEKRKELESEIRIQVTRHLRCRKTSQQKKSHRAFSQFPINDRPRFAAIFQLHKAHSHSKVASSVLTQVDELMRQELKNLKLAVNREKEQPVKAGKKKGGKKVSRSEHGRAEAHADSNQAQEGCPGARC